MAPDFVTYPQLDAERRRAMALLLSLAAQVHGDLLDVVNAIAWLDPEWEKRAAHRATANIALTLRTLEGLTDAPQP